MAVARCTSPTVVAGGHRSDPSSGRSAWTASSLATQTVPSAAMAGDASSVAKNCGDHRWVLFGATAMKVIHVLDSTTIELVASCLDRSHSFSRIFALIRTAFWRRWDLRSLLALLRRQTD
jgi:hypothetical protein